MPQYRGFLVGTPPTSSHRRLGRLTFGGDEGACLHRALGCHRQQQLGVAVVMKWLAQADPSHKFGAVFSLSLTFSPSLILHRARTEGVCFLPSRATADDEADSLLSR